MSQLTGNKDTDRLILNKLGDKDFLKACMVDKYTWNIVCDDAFLRRRLLEKYPNIEQYKKEKETWKTFFLRAIRYIALLKEKFDFDYQEGNFKKQYKIFKKYFKKNKKRGIKRNLDILLLDSVKKGELSLVKYSLKQGADIDFDDNYLELVDQAAEKGHLEVLKYLLEQTDDIQFALSIAFRGAVDGGQLEIIKYLVEERGVTLSTEDGYFAMQEVILQKRLDIIKYLVEKGVLIHPNAIKLAKKESSAEIVKYLKSKY